MTTALALDSFSDAEKRLLDEIEGALAFVVHDGSRVQDICDFLHPLPYNAEADWSDIERQAKWVLLLAFLSKQSNRFRVYVINVLLENANQEIKWWFAFTHFLVGKNDEMVFRYFQIFISRFFHKDEYLEARAILLQDSYKGVLFKDQVTQLAELASYRRYFLQQVSAFEKIMPLE